jgi:hypothetical protein
MFTGAGADRDRASARGRLETHQKATTLADHDCSFADLATSRIYDRRNMKVEDSPISKVSYRNGFDRPYRDSADIQASKRRCIS